jgi:hypothetical protein
MVSSHMQRFWASVKQQNSLQVLCIVGVAFGILVRLTEYISRRSLWGDEAMLALNLVERSYLELLKPLDYNQAAPPGFLWIEKFAIQVFGNNEYALRLFPLIAGIISLIAFYRLATRYASPVAAPIAITLFACLKYTLYYATEVKQYSSDVMVALLLWLWLVPLRDQMLHRNQLILLGLLGAVFIWLSHPTVFVLAGLEGAAFLIASNPQRWRKLVNRLPMYALWLCSFAALYFFTIRNTLSNDALTDSWGERYPDSIFDVVWFFDAFGRFFYNPLGFLDITDGIAIVTFIIGCLACYRRNRITLLFLSAPIIMTFIASYLKQYPFRERLVLFLAPLALVIVAEGIACLLTQIRRLHTAKNKLAFVLGILVAFALITPPFVRASILIVHPTQVEELRPVLTYIQSQRQPGDVLYVYPSRRYQFLYYARQIGYTEADYVIGKQAMVSGDGRERQLSEQGVKRFEREIRRLRSKPRVWFLFCATSEDEERTFLALLEPNKPLEGFRKPGAFVYLYDLN